MGKDRPQNKYLKPPFGQRDPQEEYAARRKGAYAAHAARRKNTAIRNVVQIVANLNVHGSGAAADIEKLKSLDDLDSKQIPLIAQVVQTQFNKAIAGDKDARDWICHMLGAYENPEARTGGSATAPGLEISIIRKEE